MLPIQVKIEEMAMGASAWTASAPTAVSAFFAITAVDSGLNAIIGSQLKDKKSKDRAFSSGDEEKISGGKSELSSESALESVRDLFADEVCILN